MLSSLLSLLLLLTNLHLVISLSMVSSPVTNAMVIGGGPSGLSSSIMLAQRGYHVKCFEQRPKPTDVDAATWGDFNNDRSFILGLSGRGQQVLNDLGVLDRVDRYAQPVRGRGAIQPKGLQISPNRSAKYVTKCIERDRLAACLVAEIEEKYAAQVSFAI